jgi:hypothetical protein
MQVLLPDKELTTRDETVQVSPELPVGVYRAELLLVDAAGERASASLSFTITSRLVGPVITPVTPVTPIAPVTPVRPVRPGRTPRSRKPE